MILRIFFIALLTVILWYGLKLLFTLYKLILHVRAAANGQFGQVSKEQNLDHKIMVKCAHCQLYILDRDAIIYAGKQYCCQEHASQHH